MKPSSVVVVGGGVIGLACAWELARREHEVVVLEAGLLGAGASSGNAGWICPTLVAPLPRPGMVREGLEQLARGGGGFVLRPTLSLLPWLLLFARNCTSTRYEEGVRVLHELARGTTEIVEDWLSAGVSVELHRRGLVIAARTEEGLAPYRELAARLPHVVEEVDPAVEPALDANAIAGALRATLDRHVRPESLLAGLAASLRESGAALREQWPVTSLERRGQWIVRSARADVGADAVVVAAGVGSARLLRPHGVRLRLAGARGYSVDVAGEGVPPRHALYLAEAKLALSPFATSVRIAGVLELGGRARPPDLVVEARPYLAGWQPSSASEVWSGLRPATPSGVPYVGRVADNLFAAAGHGMLGVTLAPPTARRVAQWIG